MNTISKTKLNHNTNLNQNFQYLVIFILLLFSFGPIKKRWFTVSLSWEYQWIYNSMHAHIFNFWFIKICFDCFRIIHNERFYQFFYLIHRISFESRVVLFGEEKLSRKKQCTFELKIAAWYKACVESLLKYLL